MAFKKGVSGNPKGRPKGRSLGDELRAIIEEKTEDGKMTKKRALAESLYKLAILGDIRAHALICDRVDGRVSREEGGDGKSADPIVIRIIRATPENCRESQTEQ